MCLISINSETVDLEDSEFLFDCFPIPKRASLAGLAGMLRLLLQKAECVADFGGILDLICKALKTTQLCSRNR